VQPARALALVAVVATVVCAVKLTVRQGAHAAPPGLRRNRAAAAEPEPLPITPDEPASQETWTWTGWMNSMFGGGSGIDAAADAPGVAVGSWQPGDPWPGGVTCQENKLQDAFHMKPDKGCEPNCDQCQMVCLPSAYANPFQNHGGEFGSNCFERGCDVYAGEGSKMGVTFYMYECNPELQQQWKASNHMTDAQVQKNLQQCLAECKKKDKQCTLACEVTHKEVRRPWHTLHPGAPVRSRERAPAKPLPLPFPALLAMLRPLAPHRRWRV
jgi:hypothetical protein